MIKTNYELTNNIFIWQCWGMCWRNHFFCSIISEEQPQKRKRNEKKVNKLKRPKTMSINCAAFKAIPKFQHQTKMKNLEGKKNIWNLSFRIFYIHSVTLVCLNVLLSVRVLVEGFLFVTFLLFEVSALQN